MAAYVDKPWFHTYLCRGARRTVGIVMWGFLAAVLIVASLVAIGTIFLGFAVAVVSALRPTPEDRLRRELDQFLDDLLGSPDVVAKHPSR